MLEVTRLEPLGLAPVSLTLAAGECVTLAGPSGSGKTLLLRAIADLDPVAGSVRLNGTLREDLPAPEWRRRVGYLPADSGWWADTVAEHFIAAEAWSAAAAALGLGEGWPGWTVARLSTGERQRLALLRALEVQPQVLLLDEPTSGLDAQATAAVESLLETHRKEGLALLWVTHDPAQAQRLGTRRLLLRHGRLEAP